MRKMNNYVPLSEEIFLIFLLPILIGILLALIGREKLIKTIGVGSSILFISILLFSAISLPTVFSLKIIRIAFFLTLSVSIICAFLGVDEDIFRGIINDFGAILKAEAFAILFIWILMQADLLTQLIAGIFEADQFLFAAIILYTLGSSFSSVSYFSKGALRDFSAGFFSGSLLGVIVGYVFSIIGLVGSEWSVYQTIINRFFVISLVLLILAYIVTPHLIIKGQGFGLFKGLKLESTYISTDSLQVVLGKYLKVIFSQPTYIGFLTTRGGMISGCIFLGDGKLAAETRYKRQEVNIKSLFLVAYPLGDMEKIMSNLPIIRAPEKDLIFYGLDKRYVREVLEGLKKSAEKELANRTSVIRLPFIQIMEAPYFDYVRVGPILVIDAPSYELVRLGPLKIRDINSEFGLVFGLCITADNKRCSFFSSDRLIEIRINNSHIKQTSWEFKLRKGNLKIYINERKKLKELAVNGVRITVKEDIATLSIDDKKITANKDGEILILSANKQLEKRNVELANRIIQRLENLIKKALIRFTEIDMMIDNVRRILDTIE